MMRAQSILLTFPAVLLAPSAQADDLRGVVFGGGTVSDSESVYGGVVVALPGARLGKGLAVRASANAGNYAYETGTKRIDGDYVGGEVALVYQLSGQWGWANFSAGPRLTHTRLKPSDPSNKRAGSRLDIGLQSDGARDGQRWRFSWLASVAPVDGAYQARLQLGRKFGQASYRAGIEGGVLGDPYFTQGSVGVFVALPLNGRTEMHLGSGAKFQDRRGTRAYGTVSLSSLF